MDVDFAGPLTYKLTKKEEGKCYILIFTCATSRAVHLELTNTKSAEEFEVKLNAFIARKSRPKLIVSDNGGACKATALWIRKICKIERLQDYLARQEVWWRFSLSMSPWWGGMYEHLHKDIKKALYKVLERSTLFLDQLQAIVINIEKNVNNRPLTYVESEQEEKQVLTPNNFCGDKMCIPLLTNQTRMMENKS
ncbi:Pro-Pol poly [Paramuricea clavata]|uniref:Pro-Pol poly n=1 Tax=Paramuricea clavata TaxID=317549 RepID=A0A7D9DID1_PARCT|nr:Pro-Pol poly [Paramuricea clavata]